ncbi:unnamed protein product [Diamesa serratosioi]
MAPLLINLNQLVDLSVNLSNGATINTTLLHCLLHVIVNQLNLQTCRLEFHGQGSNRIENSILEQTESCSLDLKEFDVINVIDLDTNLTYEKRNEVECLKQLEVTKIIRITDGCLQENVKTGFPLQPIPVISLEDFKKLELKVDSIHDVIGQILPTNSQIMNSGPMSNLVDILNVTKRVEALEIAEIQLAEMMKRIQCNPVVINTPVTAPIEAKEAVLYNERFNVEKTESLSIKIIDYLAELDEHPVIHTLQNEDNKLKNLIQNIPSCLCLDEDYKKALFNDIKQTLLAPFESKVQDHLNLMKLETESFGNECENMKSNQQDQSEEFKRFICDAMKAYEKDLVYAVREIQEMLDAKVDRLDLIEMKRYLLDMMTEANAKTDDFSGQLAAGATKKIMKNITCISCGDRVIQADRGMTNFKLTQTDLGEVKIDEKKLHLTNRNCGGKHTITNYRERVLQSGNFKDFLNSVYEAKLENTVILDV